MDFLYNLMNKIAHLYLFYSLYNFIYNNGNIFENDKLVKYMIDLSLKIMEYYSEGEIFYNKTKKQLIKLIESNPKLNNFIKTLNKNKIVENIEFVENGEIIKKMSFVDFMKMNEKDDFNYDFIIYSDYDNNYDEPINKIVLRKHIKDTKNIDTNTDTEMNIKYVQSGYKFIMFEIIINDEPISINLSTEKYNYLIIDNIIDKHFLKYFLKKYHHNIYNKLNDTDTDLNSYKLKIIDHNINILEFNNSPLIISRDNGICYLENNASEDKNVDDFDCVDIENYNYKFN